MGKKISSIVKNPIKAIGSVTGSLTPAGLLGGAAMGQVSDLASKALGLVKGGGSAGPELDMSRFDLSQQAARYEDLANQSRQRNLQNNQAFTQQLQQQAKGEGPSLATAQLKSAQNRNLAQTLAAAQSANANPLSTRQLLQGRGQASRDLAELGGIQRMQEQQSAQQQLGQQLAQQAASERADIGQGFDISTTPAQAMMDYEMARFGADVSRRNAVKQQQSQILGGVLGGAGSVLGGLLSDESQKQSPAEKIKQKRGKAIKESLSGMSKIKNTGEGIQAFGDAIGSALEDKKLVSDENQKKPAKLPSAKKEVSEFLDKLSAKQYEYKNPEMPGAAEGTRYGITAQDLERSTLGKSLVKNTAQGKVVDTVQGFGAVLAAQSELNKRLKKLEGKKG